ncbi:MAG: hypothetical protein ACK55U_13690, partial [Bacteroidota bacterium]
MKAVDKNSELNSNLGNGGGVVALVLSKSTFNIGIINTKLKRENNVPKSEYTKKKNSLLGRLLANERTLRNVFIYSNHSIFIRPLRN